MERKQHLAAEALWTASKSLRFEVNDPQRHLEQAREHLKTGSVLIYINHIHSLDASIVAQVVEQNLRKPVGKTDVYDHVTVLLGYGHLDPRLSPLNGLKRKATKEIQALKGFNVLYVVTPEYQNRYKDPERFNRKAFVESLRRLRLPGQVVALAPQAVTTDTLTRPQEGTGALLKLSPNTLAVPLGLHSPKIYPFLTKTKVEVGMPFAYSDLSLTREQTPAEISDAMMERLATLLPQSQQGQYGASSIT